ncbi:hypothetical protein [Polaromonas sp. CG9_12]|nr:hypothetical protein [Polaromonas sp. CG9_12]
MQAIGLDSPDAPDQHRRSWRRLLKPSVFHQNRGLRLRIKHQQLSKK